MDNNKQKIQSLLVTLAVIVFFVISAVTFMNALYCFSDIVGSTVSGSADMALRDALRSGPIFLAFFITLSGLMVAHTFYRNESSGILRKNAKKHASIGIALGVILIVYVIVMLIAGKYLSITEGSPSPLYPLDAVLYAVTFIVFGILVHVYFKKHEESGLYNGPVRAPIAKKGKIIRCFFRTLWLFFALYGFCGFFYSFFIIDFNIGYTAYSLAMMLVSLVAFLSIAVWELYYNNLSEEKRIAISVPLSLISLATAGVSSLLYFSALKRNLDGPSNVGFGILPVAYSAGVNVATFLVVAVPIIVSFVALIKGLIRKKKQKEA